MNVRIKGQSDQEKRSTYFRATKIPYWGTRGLESGSQILAIDWKDGRVYWVTFCFYGILLWIP